MAKEPKTVIAAASMAGGSSGAIGGGISGKAIEQAMADATMKALESGITDPAKILELKLAAREKVKADHRKAVAAAEAKAKKAAKAK